MSAPTAPSARADHRPLVYGVLDLVFAAMYAVLFARVTPNRFAGYSLLLWSLVAVLGVAGFATLRPRSWSWRVACIFCALQLVLTVAVLVLLVISAAFLAGVYGALGQGAAVLAMVFAALVIQLVGLLPAFQLKYLLTRAGRRRFDRP